MEYTSSGVDDEEYESARRRHLTAERWRFEVEPFSLGGFRGWIREEPWQEGKKWVGGAL